MVKHTQTIRRQKPTQIPIKHEKIEKIGIGIQVTMILYKII